MSTTITKTISLPADMTHEAISESEINRHDDALTLRPARPSWMSLAELARADADFLQERPRLFPEMNHWKRVCRILCNRDFGYCRGSLSA